jgi:hypothetical protein
VWHLVKVGVVHGEPDTVAEGAQPDDQEVEAEGEQPDLLGEEDLGEESKAMEPHGKPEAKSKTQTIKDLSSSLGV